MSSQATILAAVRLDLDDVGEVVWDDDLLERAIDRALREYSLVSPLESKDTLATESDSREVDVSALAPRIRIVAAEYPTGEYPPSFTPFSLWGDTLTLDLAAAPSGTPDVDVYWHAVHTINGTVSFPATHDDIIATGAAAFAASTAASARANTVNVGGDDVWGRYAEFAERRMAEFNRLLRSLPGAGRLRTSRLYAAADVRFRSQSTDPGPA